MGHYAAAIHERSVKSDKSRRLLPDTGFIFLSQFLQESIERLEAYDLKPKGPLSFGLPVKTAQYSICLNLEKGTTIDVEAESKKAAREGTSVLKKMRTLVQTEISSILSQLKDNQVGILWYMWRK